MKRQRRDGLQERARSGSTNRAVLLSLLFSCLIGCQDREVLLNVSQRDSLEALVALSRAGVSSYRSQSGRSGSERFSVYVAGSDYNTAAEVLHEFGLPRLESDSVEKLTEQKGFVPNSQEIARVRLDRALAAEIERMLQGLPGVIDARATVRSAIPGEQQSEPSASIVIRYLPSAGKTPFAVDDARQLTASSVAGLKPENVLVTTSRVVLPGASPSLGVGANPEGGVVALTKLAPFSFQIPESEKPEAQRQITIVFAVMGLGVALIFGVIGYVVKPSRPKGKLRPQPAPGDRFFIEGSASDASRSLPTAPSNKSK